DKADEGESGTMPLMPWVTRMLQWTGQRTAII
ncbi:hypothetical protein A2U01_0065621, partial [Trifolium medium]|nr:hypothetical protein [Trifolium medium]